MVALCVLPMELCYGAAIRRSPAQLCGFPMVPCHGAAIRHSPAQLCGFPMALLSQRLLLRCGILFRAAVSGAAADMLLAKRTKMPILCSGRWEGASGSVKVAFLQITAHVSKNQMPNNQIINF